MQGTLRISFPCPIVVTGGSNVPEGQEHVGSFAYRLVSGHLRVQTGVSRIGEEGTVTTAGVFGLNVVTGWDKRRPEWVDVAWLATRVHVGRHWKMGVADVIDVEEQDQPTTPSARKRKGRPPPKGTPRPPPPPESPAYGQPGGTGGAGGAGGGAGAEGGGARVGGASAAAAAGGGVGGARDQRGGRQPRPPGPLV